MSLIVHNQLFIDPSRLAEFRAFLEPGVVRAYPGCRSFTILEDVDQPGRVFFIQEWESREALEAYRAFQTERGARAALREMYVRPAITTYCRAFEG